MIEFMLAAPASGTGKTAVTCAVLEALSKRGLQPCAFKCGPDYIDPMFHRSILQVDSHNLDLFLSDEVTVRNLYQRYCAGHGAAVTEGVMGFYDGLGGVTDRASAWHVANTLRLPVVLVLRPKGASLTLAAQIQGMLRYRNESHIVGILLNDCSEMLYRSLSAMLEKETGLPVLGYMPHMEEADFQSRHLGLLTAREIHDLSQRIEKLAQQFEKSVNMDQFLNLCSRSEIRANDPCICKKNPVARIAVARDEAFCFMYQETLDALASAGAEIVFFSPLHDSHLPEGVGGLYLPGGYPELYTKELSENTDMRHEIKKAVESGLPTVAECGGFLYLGKELQDECGTMRKMAGVLPGCGTRKNKLVRFGYAELTAQKSSLLFREGETIPVHEFHYWDSSENGTDFAAQKPITGRSWQCGFASPSMYAAFPHLYFAGNPQMANRFVSTAAAYTKETGRGALNG